MNVLVVDDNRDAADSTAMLLELWGHTARTAYDGESGWAVIREWHPDFLLLDINMPGLDGYALAARVKQTPGLEGVPVAALSAYSDANHLRRVADAGFDHRLTKPADPRKLKELLTMIEQIKHLAERTGELAQQNATPAAETKDLLQEVKEDIKQLKEDVREIKDAKAGE